ncbi:MAG: hypothetical protein L0Y56_20500 [Nitrospira sp.]|nr:hypothetical protein [Nitrospira sp.]
MLVSGAEDLVSALPIRWTPSLAVSGRYDDNVLLVKENKASDFTAVLSPQLRVSSSGGRVSGYVQYRPEIERYIKKPELSTIRHFADLEWITSMTQSASITLRDHFTYTPDSVFIGLLGTATPRGDTFSNDSSVTFHTTNLDLSYRYGRQSFKEARLTDTQSHDLHEGVTLPFTARLDFTQSYHLRYFTQERDAAFRSHTTGTGLKYHVSPTLSIGTGAGIIYWRALSDDAFRSRPTFSFDLQKAFKQLKLDFSFLQEFQTQLRGQVEYTLRKTVVRADYSKELVVGGGELAGAVNGQRVGIHMLHTMGKKTDLTITGGYSSYKPIAGPRGQLVVYRGEASLAYIIRSWLRTTLSYNYLSQNAGDPGQQEFTRNQVMFSLTATMP